MTAPRRLLVQPASPEDEVVAKVARVAPEALPSEGWEQVLERAVASGPSLGQLAPLFLTSVALGALLVLALRPSSPPLPRSELVVAADSRWSRIAPDEFSLQSGRLEVSRPAGNLRIVTPDAVLETVGGRFLAEVTEAGTLLTVEEGEVVLRAGGREHAVRAGQSLAWPPAPQIPPQLEAAPPVMGGRCASAARRRDCLREEASREGLDAQSALFELGLLEVEEGRLEAGLGAWRESLARFPDGVLHPEVRLASMRELARARRYAEARAIATEFELRCADDPRLAEVRRFAAQLHRP